MITSTVCVFGQTFHFNDSAIFIYILFGCFVCACFFCCICVVVLHSFCVELFIEHVVDINIDIPKKAAIAARLLGKNRFYMFCNIFVSDFTINYQVCSTLHAHFLQFVLYFISY